MFWLNVVSNGTYNSSRYKKLGVPDILGIWHGKPLAIEVKASKGRIREDQRKFIADFKNHGGLAFIARSIEDVMENLKCQS